MTAMITKGNFEIRITYDNGDAIALRAAQQLRGLNIQPVEDSFKLDGDVQKYALLLREDRRGQEPVYRVVHVANSLRHVSILIDKVWERLVAKTSLAEIAGIVLAEEKARDVLAEYERNRQAIIHPLLASADPLVWSKEDMDAMQAYKEKASEV